MTHRFADVTFTDSVKAAQEQYGSREHNDNLQENFGPNDQLSKREADFIGERDTFYLASVSDTGWPYVQHRGGPLGFLKVIGKKQLAYADFSGNKQLISVGNLAANDRCSIMLMDYPNRRRLKLVGHIHFEDVERAAPKVVAQISLPDYRARIERVALIDVEAFDWNCPQHITPRYTEAEWASRISDTPIPVAAL